MKPTPPTQHPPTQPPAATDPVIGRPARAWVGRRPESPPAGTDDSFDALTDLFMGEVASGRNIVGTPDTRGVGAPSSSTAAIGPARPVLRLAGGDEERSLQPAPVAEPAAAGGHRQYRDLGEPVVECLSLSNLPVLASAWASQYVREIAAAAGRPVAVLRVQAGFASLDVIGEWAGESGTPRIDPVDDLAAALRLAAELTDRWIIRCAGPEQRDLATREMIRVLTVLTGADEAAAAAAMQAVDIVRPGLPEAGGPMFRLAVMGVVDEKSTAAGHALALAAESRLGRRVQRVVCSSKILSARAPMSIFSGAVDQELPAIVGLLESVLGIRSVASPIAAPTPEPAHADVLADTPESPRPIAASVSELTADITGPSTPAIDLAWERAWPSVAAAPASPIARDALDDIPLPEPDIAQPTVVHVVEPVKSLRQPSASSPASLMPWLGEEAPAGESITEHLDTGRPVDVSSAEAVGTPVAAHLPVTVSRASQQAAPPADLWTYVPGLAGTQIRCPYALAIEFGVDDSGSLHLLAHAASAAKQDSALADLLVAASWAAAHAALLGARQGTPRPVMHVFTDQPKRSRRLLDTDVRVHVLAPVSVGAHTGWYCAELN